MCAHAHVCVYVCVHVCRGILPIPKSGVRSAGDNTAGQSRGKSHQDSGQGEVLFSLADADPWPPLHSPQACQPLSDHRQLPHSSGCLGGRGGSHFMQEPQLLAQPSAEGKQLLGEAAGWVGGAFATATPLIQTLPRPRIPVS